MEDSRSMSKIPQILREDEQQILGEWMRDMSSSEKRSDLINAEDLRQQCDRFLRLFQQATQSGQLTEVTGEPYALVRDFLTELSESRARRGFTPSETARFVFSLKRPIFARLRVRESENAEALF